MTMSLVQDVLGIFRKDWKLFLAVNVFFFGTVLVGAVIALLSPSTQGAVIDIAAKGLTSGPFSGIGSTYESGNILGAALVTFVFNFFVGTLVDITVPSVIFPPWALFMGLIRALLWGIALVVPYGSLTPARLVPHYLTMLLEGEGYVVAIFACVRQIFAILDPQRFGEKSRWKAYLHAVVDNLKLLPVVALLLAVSALYEAWEVMFFAGILK